MAHKAISASAPGRVQLTCTFDFRGQTIELQAVLRLERVLDQDNREVDHRILGLEAVGQFFGMNTRTDFTRTQTTTGSFTWQAGEFPAFYLLEFTGELWEVEPHPSRARVGSPIATETHQVAIVP